jgi:hypothetical protein
MRKIRRMKIVVGVVGMSGPFGGLVSRTNNWMV